MRIRHAQKTEADPPYQEVLEPEAMRTRLWRYRKELGGEFGLPELLKLEEIRAKLRLAEALCGLSVSVLNREP